MNIGYARVSTADQSAGMEAQLRELAATGCTDKMFAEATSSVAKRDQLEAALDFCREGDCLIVTKLDRLCRSVADLVAITERLRSKGVALRILSMNLDTTTPTGKLMLNLLGSRLPSTSSLTFNTGANLPCIATCVQTRTEFSCQATSFVQKPLGIASGWLGISAIPVLMMLVRFA